MFGRSFFSTRLPFSFFFPSFRTIHSKTCLDNPFSSYQTWGALLTSSSTLVRTQKLWWERSTHSHHKKPTLVRVPRHRLSISFARSSGPGGQNVNKVNTKVDLRFDVESAEWLPPDVKERFLDSAKHHINKHGEFHIQSEKFRLQHQNIDDAISKLQGLIDEATTPPKERILTKIPQWSMAERRKDKKRKSDVKHNRKKVGWDD